jgi:hypothetical protein
MGKIREWIRRTIPWIEPVIEYFDWKKQITAAGFTVVIAVGAVVKDLPWPIIVAITLMVLVHTMYFLAFPAFLKLVHTGVKARPDNNIWKHKRQFYLFEAACLLADAEPIANLSKMDGDSRAWYSGLCEAVRLKQIGSTPARFPNGRSEPNAHTEVTAENLKAFCEARERKPEFLTWK